MRGTIISPRLCRILSRTESAGRSRFAFRIRGVEFFDNPARPARLRSQIHRQWQNAGRHHPPNGARAAVVPLTNALDPEVTNVWLTHTHEDKAQTRAVTLG